MRELNLVKQVNHQMLLLHEITNFDHLFDDYTGFVMIFSSFGLYMYTICSIIASLLQKYTFFSLNRTIEMKKVIGTTMLNKLVAPCHVVGESCHIVNAFSILTTFRVRNII